MNKKTSNQKEYNKKSESSSKEVVDSVSKIKDFVQDNFFEKGHFWMKIRQISMSLVFLFVVIFPVFILFNSIIKKHLWKHLYYWKYNDSFQLTNHLKDFILLAFVFILVCSLVFLFRNNCMEQKVYPKKKTYNEQNLEKRKIIMNDMYTERFGDKEFRETTKFYAVDGIQNLPDQFVSDLFKKGGVEIK